jgi:pyruvate dehydrogenase E1 component alpha subunit
MNKKELLRTMIRIRLFEEKISEYKLKGIIKGPVHSCIGQEAVSAGVCSALDKNDYVIGNHRSHGHIIAKGTDLKKLVHQIFHDAGSMHVYDPSIGFILSTAIVGSGLSLACGVAFASKLKKDKRIVCVFFGDGAVSEGTFHECMNIASMWRLPVLFVLENNHVAVTTVNKSHINMGKLTSAYGVDYCPVDGQDVVEVNTIASDAIEYVVRDNNPLYTKQNLIDKYGEEGIEIFKTLNSTEWRLGPERYKVSSLSIDNVQSLLRFRKEHDTIVKELEENLHLLFHDILKRKNSNIMLENILGEYGEAAYEALKDKLDDRNIKKGISPYGEEKFLNNKLYKLLAFLEEFGFPSSEFNSLLKSSIEFSKTSKKGSFNESMDKLFNLLESSKKFNASTYYMNKLKKEEGITPQQKQEAQIKFQEYVNTTGNLHIEGFKE